MDHQPPPPSKARRVAVVAASLVAIGAAVVVLREPEAADEGPRPIPAPQTTVASYAADGVVLPAPGTPPVQPERLDVRPGPGRLALSWPTATGAVGYEVRWGDRTRLVAQPAVQLDGLTDEQQYRVEGRSVGPHGERSLAAITHAAPHPAEARDWAFADEFDAGPGKWRLSTARWVCARHSASAGTWTSPIVSCSVRNSAMPPLLPQSRRWAVSARAHRVGVRTPTTPESRYA
ncbi:hypothetical protein GCM10023148_41280 [Actinokineospora soli]